MAPASPASVAGVRLCGSGILARGGAVVKLELDGPVELDAVAGEGLEASVDDGHNLAAVECAQVRWLGPGGHGQRLAARRSGSALMASTSSASPVPCIQAVNMWPAICE
jgi:hypothetical protein